MTARREYRELVRELGPYLGLMVATGESRVLEPDEFQALRVREREGRRRDQVIDCLREHYGFDQPFELLPNRWLNGLFLARWLDGRRTLDADVVVGGSYATLSLEEMSMSGKAGRLLHIYERRFGGIGQAVGRQDGSGTLYNLHTPHGRIGLRIRDAVQERQETELSTVAR